MGEAFKDRLSSDIKTAMKAGDKEKLGALRLIAAAVKQYEVDKRADVDDNIAVELLTRMAKQRRESIGQYEAGNRPDLVAKEQFELDIIGGYLPTPLSSSEIAEQVSAAIASSGATGIRDMGKVMALLKSSLAGRADMAAVSAEVKTRLSS